MRKGRGGNVEERESKVGRLGRRERRKSGMDIERSKRNKSRIDIQRNEKVKQERLGKGKERKAGKILR